MGRFCRRLQRGGAGSLQGAGEDKSAKSFFFGYEETVSEANLYLRCKQREERKAGVKWSAYPELKLYMIQGA